MSKVIVNKFEAATIAGLISALSDIEASNPGKVIYCDNGNFLKINEIQETLSDGSTSINVELTSTE